MSILTTAQWPRSVAAGRTDSFSLALWVGSGKGVDELEATQKGSTSPPVGQLGLELEGRGWDGRRQGHALLFQCHFLSRELEEAKEGVSKEEERAAWRWYKVLGGEFLEKLQQKKPEIY